LEYVRTLRGASVAFCDVLAPHRTDAFTAFKPSAALRDKVMDASEKIPPHAGGRPVPSAPHGCTGAVRRGREYLSGISFRSARPSASVSTAFWRSVRTRGRACSLLLPTILFQGTTTVANVSASIRWHALNYCPEKVFEESLAKVGEESWYDWGAIKYFLYE